MTDNNPFKIFEDKPAAGLDGKYKKSWVEESFDIEAEVANRLTFSHTRNYLGTSINAKRIKKFLVIIAVGLTVIFVRTFYLQTVRGSYYHDLAEGNRIRLRAIPSERGIFYDRFNKELVQNVPNFSLAIIPQDLPRGTVEREKIIAKLSELSGLSQDDLKELVKKNGF